MPRGKRDVSRTQRILKGILTGRPFKQIAYEENIPVSRVSYLKNRYLSENSHLTLNDEGVRVMNEEQLYFTFFPSGDPNAQS